MRGHGGRAHAHAAEFRHAESPVIFADPFRPVERRPGGSPPHEQGNDDEGPREQHRGAYGQQQIKRAFHQIPPSMHARKSHARSFNSRRSLRTLAARAILERMPRASTKRVTTAHSAVKDTPSPTSREICS